MTKKEHIESVRLRPLGEDGLDQIRQIVRQRQAAKVNEVLIDMTTANTIVSVFGAINEKNKAKLLTMPVARVVDVCWKAVH